MESKDKSANLGKLPEIMLASFLIEAGKIELQHIPVPSPGSGEVLVRIDAVGSCGSDTHFYKSGAIGDLVVRGPVILGHEAAGTIVAVGDGVKEDRVGQLVSIEPQKPCRKCEFCKRGDYHLCAEMEFYGAWPIHGAFSDYVLIDSDFAFQVPEGMDAENAALVEPVSVAVHACRHAGVTAGSSVFIAGAGPIGIMMTQVAKAFGASRVVVSDPTQNRRKFVETKGADATLDPANDSVEEFIDQFDVFIDASGATSAIISSLPVIKRGGRAVLVGMGADELNLPFAYLQQKEIKLSGTFRYVNTWPTAIKLIADGRVDTSGIVTSRHGLDEVEQALLSSSSDPNAIKAMVIPDLTKRS